VTHDDAWLARAIDRYHELCTDPSLAGPPVVSAFVERQRRAHLTFGGTVQCRSLRPAFITTNRMAQLRAAVTALWTAFRKIEQKAIADASLAAQLGLSEQERALIAIDPGYDDATVISRLDTYFGESPRVLEYNADSPAGMSYQAGQASFIRALPIMQRFAQEFQLEEMRADVALRETLLGVWYEFSKRKALSDAGAPTVAIVDLLGAATSPEFELVARDLREHGAQALIATPDDLTYEDGKLRAGGRAIDLVYKRLLVADFLGHYDLRHPLISAYADGAVCVASSFRCTIAHKKKALVALLDPAHAHWFTGEERTAIGHLVVPTWPLDARSPAELSAGQPNMVLKPNDAHGGENIVLGWECSQAQWEASLQAARAGGFVVQQRVAPKRESYPVFDAVHPELGANVQEFIEDCNAYVFRGVLGGVLTRLSQSSIINVSRGGQAIPTFVLRPRV
jgi:uncharacterized circularly permuted ATP-grasp superfamily protein